MHAIKDMYAVGPAALPAPGEPELFQTLALGSGPLRIERIVSNEQVTPEGE